MTERAGGDDWIIEPSSDGDDRDEAVDSDAAVPVRPFEDRLSPTQPQDGDHLGDHPEGFEPASDDGPAWRWRLVPRVVWFVMAIGITMAAVGVGVGFSTWRFLQVAESTEGVVVEFVENRSREDGRLRITYAPRVEFTSADGEVTTFVSNTRSGSPSHEIGDPVDVLYDPDDASNANIDSWIGLWLIPIIFTIVGFIVLAITITLARHMGRTAAARS